MRTLRVGPNGNRWFSALLIFNYTWIRKFHITNHSQSLGTAARRVLQAHSLCTCLFPFAFSRKPEDFDAMPGRQTIYCWTANVRGSCSAESLPGATARVLRDAIRKTLGHGQLKCAHVSSFFYTIHEAKEMFSSNNLQLKWNLKNFSVIHLINI